MHGTTPQPARIRRGGIALAAAAATILATLAGGAPASAAPSAPASVAASDNAVPGGGSPSGAGEHGVAPAVRNPHHPAGTGHAPTGHSSSATLPPTTGAHLASYSLSGTISVPSGTPSTWWSHVSVVVAPAPDYCDDNDCSASGLGGSTAVTNTGSWQVNGLSPADYTVHYVVDGQVNLVDQYWRSGHAAYDATAVHVTTASKTGITIALKKGKTITGHVSIPGDADAEWLNGVSVELGYTNVFAAPDYEYDYDYGYSHVTVPVDPVTGNYTVTGVISDKYPTYAIRTVTHDYDLGDGPVTPLLVGGFGPHYQYALGDIADNNPDAFSVTSNKTVNLSLVAGSPVSGTVTLPELPDGTENWESGLTPGDDGFSVGAIETICPDSDVSALDPTLAPTGAITIGGYEADTHTASYQGVLPAGTQCYLLFANELDTYDYDRDFWFNVLESGFSRGTADLTGATTAAAAVDPIPLWAYVTTHLDWTPGLAAYVFPDFAIDLPDTALDNDDDVNLVVSSISNGVTFDQTYPWIGAASDADSGVLRAWTDPLQVPLQAAWTLDATAVDYHFDSHGLRVYDAAEASTTVGIAQPAGGAGTISNVHVPASNLRTDSYVVTSVPKNSGLNVAVALYKQDGAAWDELGPFADFPVNASKSTKNVTSGFALWDLDPGTYTIGISADAYAFGSSALSKAYPERFLGNVASIDDPGLQTFQISDPGTVALPSITVSALGSFAATGVSVSGPSLAAPGDVLTVATGDWTPTPTALSVQWYRGSTAIKGATHTTYTVANADGGASISARVTGKRSGYSSKTVKSSTSIPVIKTLTAPTPKISGKKQLSATLTAVTGRWTTGTVLHYQWYRGTYPMPDSDYPTYTVYGGDLGPDNAITVAVTGSKDGYATRTVTSAPFVVPTDLPGYGSYVANFDHVFVGNVLTATPVGPTGAKVKYQWLRGTTKIAGATKASYTIGTKDAGKSLVLRITMSAPGYITKTYDREPMAVSPTFSHVPTLRITGTPIVGQSLTAALAGTWTPASPELHYQWLRNGQPVGTDAATYAVTADDLQTSITVKVTASATASDEVRVLTSSAVKVGKPFTVFEVSTNESSPGIVGEVLHSVVTVSPSATLKYQWYRSGTAIPGATHSTYTIVAADAGYTVTVGVTASKSGYVTTTANSADFDGGVGVPV